MIAAVLFKQIETLQSRTGLDPETNFTAAADWIRLNDPLSEKALEQAVRLKETHQVSEVWALFLGSRLLDNEARRALALGADFFVWLKDSAWDDLDSAGVALVLSRAVQKISARMVLAGVHSLDRGLGEIGPLVAACLNYPFFSPLVRLSLTREGDFLAERALGQGDREELVCRPPLVLAVDKTLVEVRYPSHLRHLEALSREIKTWNRKDLGFLEDESMGVPAAPATISYPRPRTKPGPRLDGALPALERIDWLLAGRQGQKDGMILEGEPEDLARRLTSYLKNKKFL